jgi:basic amino acid/polyamine antiporter, APA family
VSSPAQPSLVRRLGPLDAAAIIVSNVIGGGILFTSPQIAAHLPAPGPFLAIWAAGGLLAFAGAMAYAELAALRPKAGGEYVYLDAAFGRLAAFLTGWTSFVAGFSGAIASSAMIFGFYLGRFVPGASSTTPLFVVPLPWVPLTLSPQALVAVAVIALMAWVHIRGLGPGRLVGNVLAALKVTALVSFIALGLTLGTGSAANLQTSAAANAGAGPWLLALVPVMFTYSGWNAATYVAEEIRDPGRNVPIALAIGTVAVVVIYLLVNLLYLYVLPIDALAAVQGSVLDVVADRLLGTRAGDVMGVVSLISLAASISAMTIAGPRVYYAMARDGVFLAAAGRVHSTYRTPALSIVAQAAWASVLVLSGGADALIRYTGFAVILFAGVAVTALFVLRAREPNAPRPFKALGYPVAPALFALASFLIVANAIYSDPRPSGAGVLIILLGLPVYLIFARRIRLARAADTRPPRSRSFTRPA